ncbi:MAG TPA: 2Fe-2S iron-sulfur cluster-binding protein [Chthoniobacterales bacterium]|nr:2Fe-2S iron-sulfur cluster-binding protein [Chthoniobacterales bacterium]
MTLVVLEALGAILLALVVGQTCIFFATSFRRLIHQRAVEKFSYDLLREQLQTARGLRKKTEDNAAPWNGIRKFSIRKKVMETEDISSFYLEPHDRKPLPSFLPGQYLTFELRIPGQKNKTVRCYSLSDGPRTDFYRVSIKRLGAPPDKEGVQPGLVSNYFHTHLKEGDIVDVKAPGGHFSLDPTETGGVVLISGGIGVTPMLSMLNTLVEMRSTREIHFFYGVRNRAEHAMKEHLEKVARENPNVHLYVCYSKPDEGHKPGQDYQHASRVSVELLKQLLPSNNYDFYICGPGPLMESLTTGLSEWGVPDKNVHFETFGPSSVKKVAEVSAASQTPGQTFSIEFKKSGKKLVWAAGCTNILQLAMDNDINIPSGCRAGSCGTCQVAVFSGEVAYVTPSDFATERGTRLTCIGAPKGDVVLDA